MHTLDPTKSEWADYAAVKHGEGTYPETSTHATCQGTLGHSRLRSLSHRGLIRAEKVDLECELGGYKFRWNLVLDNYATKT